MGAGFAYRATVHDRAWHFLRSIDADFALLQEVIVPEWAFELWGRDRIAYLPRRPGDDWGTAVVSNDRPIELHKIDAAATPWLHELRGAATITRTLDGGLRLISIHSHASPVPEKRFAKGLSRPTRRCRDDAVWEIELIAEELQPIVHGEQFVAGGDLNSSLLFDEVYGRHRNNWKLFDNLRSQGFIDTRDTQHEQRTFFRGGAREYQLDHVFADRTTAGRVVGWNVLRDAAQDLELSDHAPVLVDFAGPDRPQAS